MIKPKEEPKQEEDYELDWFHICKRRDGKAYLMPYISALCSMCHPGSGLSFKSDKETANLIFQQLTPAEPGEQEEIWEEMLEVSTLPYGYTVKQRIEQVMIHYTIQRKH